MSDEKAMKWVEERLVYIAQYCDLKIEENKKTYDVLSYIQIKLKEGE